MATPQIERENDKFLRKDGKTILVPKRLIIRFSSEVRYETVKVTSANKEELWERIFPFERMLDYPQIRTAREVIRNVQPRAKRRVEAVFARTLPPDEKDVGVVTQEIVDISEGKRDFRVISVGMKAIVPDYRDRGIGTEFTIDALLRHRHGLKEGAIIAMTGRFRKVGVLGPYRNSGLIAAIYPLDGAFQSYIPKVEEKVLPISLYKEVDWKTGLCSAKYPVVTDLRDFIPPESNEQAQKDYQKMLKIGVIPGGSFGLRYWAEADRSKLDIAIAGYHRIPELTEVKSFRRKIFRLLRLPFSGDSLRTVA